MVRVGGPELWHATSCGFRARLPRAWDDAVNTLRLLTRSSETAGWVAGPLPPAAVGAGRPPGDTPHRAAIRGASLPGPGTLPSRELRTAGLILPSKPRCG